MFIVFRADGSRQMKLGVTLPLRQIPLAETVDFLRYCEDDLGYEAAWAGEVSGPDFPSLLGAAAEGTNLSLGVGVAPVQTRVPWLLATTAMTLSHLSNGKFSLGVGPSSEVIVSKWSGLPFDKPLRHVREVLDVLRPLLAGERVTYSGDFVHIDGFRLPQEPLGEIPIYIGALNTRSLRQAGELGDGLCLNQLAPEHVPTLMNEAKAGAAAANREAEDLSVMARIFCIVTDDIAGSRETIRRKFAPYVATTVYNRFYESLGFNEEAADVLAASRRDDRQAMVSSMSDELVDTIAIIGDEDHVAQRVADFGSHGVDIAIISPLSDDREGAERTLSAVASLNG
jgi:probable F420-dependent oxidoreductase